MFERVNRLTIDDMISIMENHNVTGKPVKLLSMGYSESKRYGGVVYLRRAKKLKRQ